MTATTQATTPDLHNRVALALEYSRNNPDRGRDFRPYFSYQLLHAPAFMLHTFFDTPHVAGRFLDTIGRAASMGLRADEEVEAGLTRQLFGSIGDDGFGYADPGRTFPREAVMHDQRELLLGLNSLIVHHRSERALDAARKLCRTVDHLTRDLPDVPGPTLRADGSWSDPTLWEPFRYPSANLGRMVTAFNQLYLITHDALPLELARRFVDYNLARGFHTDGTFTPWAGFHLHSITGFVEAVAEFGTLVNEHDYLRRVKLIYDVGLRPYRSSFGWVKENISNQSNDGEGNNTGDVLRSALFLGRAGYPEYYEEAERMLRNHLLATQLLDVEWIRANEEPTRPDEHDRTYRNIAERARGGFGFTSPNDWVTDQQTKAKMYPLNADIVQGSVQAIVECWLQAVVRERAGIKVNLFFSRENEDLKLMCEGQKVEITTKHNDNVWVRVPTWAKRGEIAVQVNSTPRPTQTNGGYLLVDGLSAGDTITVYLPRTRQQIEEHVNYRIYQVEWEGDTVVSLTPPGPHIPLYVKK
jgi:hypothetical protein